MTREGGIYHQCGELIDQAFCDEISPDDINHVGMIGGSTESAGLMEYIQQKFKNLKQPPSINDRFTAVTSGAAIYCYLIKHSEENTNEMHVQKPESEPLEAPKHQKSTAVEQNHTTT